MISAESKQVILDALRREEEFLERALDASRRSWSPKALVQKYEDGLKGIAKARSEINSQEVSDAER